MTRNHDRKAGRTVLTADDEHYLALRRALDETAERYEDLFELAPIGLLTLGEHGLVREVNAFMCGLLGREPHVILDRPIITKIFDEDRRVFLDQLRRCLVGSVRSRCGIRFVRLDGEVTPTEVLFQCSRFNGSPVVRAVVLDLTEQQRHERERLAAELERERLQRDKEISRRASEAKDRFLAVLSHELRTPLTPVMFALARLSAMPDLAPAALPFIRVMTRNLDLERQLIDDLLDMNRLANGKFVIERQPVEVHDIVRDALGVMQREIENRSLQTHVALDAAESTVLGDANRLRQVFWNLLANAVKFTGAGDQVFVRSSNTPSGRLLIGVRDTGIGIDATHLPFLFEPFEQAHRGDAAIGGLGLGLSICKGVIEAHHGHISATSAGPGHGTTFEIELPVYPASGPAAT